MKVTVVWSSLSHVFSFCFNESRKEKVKKVKHLQKKRKENIFKATK